MTTVCAHSNQASLASAPGSLQAPTRSSGSSDETSRKSPFHMQQGPVMLTNPALAMFMSAPKPHCATPQQQTSPGLFLRPAPTAESTPPALFASSQVLNLLEPRSTHQAALTHINLNPFMAVASPRPRPATPSCEELNTQSCQTPAFSWENVRLSSNLSSPQTTTTQPVSIASFATASTHGAIRRTSTADTATASGPNTAGLLAMQHAATEAYDSLKVVPTAVKQMLAELPAELQPVVMAKVSMRGRGGRAAAADPRSVDPNMDPRKARRILSNRQSAAKSKLKTRVLLETLRVGKDIMAEQNGSVQQELNRLMQLVQDLTARNRQLETRLALWEQQQHQQHQQQPQQQLEISRTSLSAPCSWQTQQKPAQQQQQQLFPQQTITCTSDALDEQVKEFLDDDLMDF